MGLDPKSSNATTVAGATLSNGVFSLSFPHQKAAADVALTAEVSPDFTNWSALPATQTLDSGPVETLTVSEAPLPGVARFFRLRAVRQ